MNKSRKIYQWFALALILFFTSCDFDSLFNRDSDKDKLSTKTLRSIEKLDDYPFYTMTYSDDYKFDEYLATGNRPDFSEANINIQPEKIDWACTCFAAMGDSSTKLFGRNFDFYHKGSLLLFTDPKVGYASVATVDIYYCGYSNEIPMDDLENQKQLLNAPYFCFDGMNEKGVAIGLMAVPSADPPYSSGKRTIYDLDVIRLVLDYAENTEAAIGLIKQYNISFGSIPLHYLIADRSGNSAIVEFVDKKIVVISNNETWQVSTNFTVFGTKYYSQSPCWRYNTANSTLKYCNGKIASNETMDLLKDVSQNTTMWSVIYDMNSKQIRFAVGRDYEDIKLFNLK